MLDELLPLVFITYIGFNYFTYLTNDRANVLKPINNNQVEDTNEDDLEYRLLNRDSSVVNNPLVAPEQRVETQQYPKIKLYEKTRGSPDNYQMVGLLYNANENVKYQLYGRRIYPGAYQWEYYIRGKDSSGLDFKFPLPQKDEIHDGDTITVPLDNITFTVKIYDYNLPRYNPFI